jgi:hypothetical protein
MTVVIGKSSRTATICPTTRSTLASTRAAWYSERPVTSGIVAAVRLGTEEPDGEVDGVGMEGPVDEVDLNGETVG